VESCALKGRDNSPGVCGAPSGRDSPHTEIPGSRGLDPGLTSGTPLACKALASSPNGYTGAGTGAGAERGLIIVTGATGAQRARALLEVAARHARELHLVVPQQARACSHEELEMLVPKNFRGKIHRATVEKLFPSANRCALSDKNAPIIVTGSIYLLGEVLARLHPQTKAEGRLQDF